VGSAQADGVVILIGEHRRRERGTRERSARLRGRGSDSSAFEGRKHDALSDARGVAVGFIAFIRKGAPDPFFP